jgi:hypothetical protein
MFCQTTNKLSGSAKGIGLQREAHTVLCTNTESQQLLKTMQNICVPVAIFTANQMSHQKLFVNTNFIFMDQNDLIYYAISLHYIYRFVKQRSTKCRNKISHQYVKPLSGTFISLALLSDPYVCNGPGD